jgi:hypothetical protein
MSPHVKKSHVFITKPKPKAKSSPAKSKKEKPNSHLPAVPQSDTAPSVSESIYDYPKISVASSWSGELRETSAVTKGKSPRVFTSVVVGAMSAVMRNVGFISSSESGSEAASANFSSMDIASYGSGGSCLGVSASMLKALKNMTVWR